ncbi:MAG TPA: hypothetical protein VLD19_01500, partial [Chitinophagaceae bacterium]|nr:hypothetical protein [Chitinophagaceae bacterium]
MDGSPLCLFPRRRSMAWRLSAVLAFLPIMACHSPAKDTKTSEHCFYYWKSVFAPGNAEKTALQQLQVKKLYVKFFDVTWQTEDHVARPVARLSIKDTSLRGFTVVPVVFITNETL